MIGGAAERSQGDVHDESPAVVRDEGAEGSKAHERAEAREREEAAHDEAAETSAQGKASVRAAHRRGSYLPTTVWPRPLDSARAENLLERLADQSLRLFPRIRQRADSAYSGSAVRRNLPGRRAPVRMSQAPSDRVTLE